MPNVAVRTGKAATISRFDARAVQQKTGMRLYPIPGARIFNIVVVRLIPDNRVPRPEICSDHK